MIAVTLFTALASAQDGGNQLEGYRIGQGDSGSGVAVYTRFVGGADGGTRAAVLVGRHQTKRASIAVSVPVAAHRIPGGRDAGLGNLELSAYWARPGNTWDRAFGIEAHTSLGDRAYTWVNAPEEIWPGAGMRAALQLRQEGDTSYLLRFALGVNGARGFDPFPEVWVAAQAAGAIDRRITDRIGVLGEMAIQYWDTSPWEVSGLVRVDATDTLRVRGGLVLPMATWTGWNPTNRPAGVRESTLLIDASMAF